jgi:AcrR family transcriptional regulator
MKEKKSGRRTPGSGRRKPLTRMSSEERRKSILEAARPLLLAQGIKGVRTRELAKAAGVSEASLFSHFASKEELIDEALIKPFRQIFEAQTQQVRDLGGLSRKALREKSVQLVAEGAGALDQLFPSLMSILFSDYQLGVDFYRKYVFAEMLAPDFASIRQLLDIEDPRLAETLGYMGFGMQLALCMDRYFRGTTHDPVVAAEAYVDIVMNVGKWKRK